MLNTRVKEITPTGVVLSTGERVGAETVISTVGNSPHPLISKFGVPQEKGRILVDECLRIQDSTHLWAIGDSALVPDVRRGGYCPPTAQYALRQGRHCARNVLATIRNQPARPFEFGGLGQLAIVGKHCGVAQIFGWRISGWIAWWLWRSVYLMKLPGLRSKVRVGLDWGLDLLFPSRHHQNRGPQNRTAQTRPFSGGRDDHPARGDRRSFLYYRGRASRDRSTRTGPAGRTSCRARGRRFLWRNCVDS